MKSLDNKGFAVSTMLYGLLIVIVLIMFLLINTMSFNRKNSKEFTDTIVKDLEKKVEHTTTAYIYNDSTCVLGTESGCQSTECYKKNRGTCAPGTIIRYWVNDYTLVTFHVINDDGNVITMQSQKNTLSRIEWSENDILAGPVTVLPKLEEATATWDKVREITYTPGGGPIAGNYYADCYMDLTSNEPPNSYCSASTTYYYTVPKLPQRSVRSRMITFPEILKLGCRNVWNNNYLGSCPKWMYNYLNGCKTYGCTVEDSDDDYYWTMSLVNYKNYVAIVYRSSVYVFGRSYELGGARAVVEINKES